VTCTRSLCGIMALSLGLLLAPPALAKKSLGSRCNNNNECRSGFCDAGMGSSGTSTCVPRRGTGGPGDHCTNNNHCRSGKCNGLRALGGGRWRPGKCAGKQDLGKRCSNNNECKSGFCDRGMGSSGTSTCVPRSGTGATGSYCTNNRHCRSGVCTARKCGGKKQLGARCGNNGECASGFCDRGMGSGNTGKCVPRAGTGRVGDYCSNNRHCKRGLRCPVTPTRRGSRCRR
jgi:hypothetical protein